MLDVSLPLEHLVWASTRWKVQSTSFSVGVNVAQGPLYDLAEVVGEIEQAHQSSPYFFTHTLAKRKKEKKCEHIR